MLVALNKLGIIFENWGENFRGDDEVDRFEMARFIVGIIQFMKRNPPESLN